MDSFWQGVLSTIIVGIPASLVSAAIWKYWFEKWLEGRSARLLARNRKRDLARYYYAKRLFRLDVLRDAYFRAISLATTIAFVVGSAALVASLVAATGVQASDPVLLMAASITLAIFGIGVLFFGFIGLLKFLRETRDVGTFSAYEEEIVQKYGADALRDPEVPTSGEALKP